jgi:hypothetical protein
MSSYYMHTFTWLVVGELEKIVTCSCNLHAIKLMTSKAIKDTTKENIGHIIWKMQLSL